jgi:opacity protein-like surface antigen
MHWLRRSCYIAMLMMLSAALLRLPLVAQAVPAAYRSPHVLWVGAEFSDVRASFPYQSSQRLFGVGAFADFKLNGRIGIEGDARFLRFGGFENSTESSYLAGPKAYFLTRGRLHPYAKLLVGAGKIHYPFEIGDASYFALAPGAGSDYRLSSRWMLRAEYEVQMWLNSPGYANEPSHELTPNGFHVGVAYRVFR